MNGTQVALTADLIIDDYSHLQIDDIKLCLRNAMKGKYGPVYNRIDGSVVLGWFKAYNRERCSLADDLSFREHKSLRGQENEQKQSIVFDAYRKEMEQRALSGDEEAKKALEATRNIEQKLFKSKTEKQRNELSKFYNNETK